MIQQIDLVQPLRMAKPVTSAEDDAKEKLTLGRLSQEIQEGSLNIEKVKADLETARTATKKAVEVTRILSEGGDPASTHRKLMAVDHDAAEKYRAKVNADAAIVAPAVQQTPEFNVGAAPLFGMGDMTPAQQETERVVALPSKPQPFLTIQGQTVNQPTRSARQVLEEKFNEARRLKDADSANKIAEKKAELQTAAQIKAGEPVKVGRGDAIVVNGEEVYRNPDAPKNQTEYDQQLAAFNSNPDLVKQFGAGPIGFIGFQNDQAIKRHRTEAQQTADANSAASEPKEIPVGSPDFKIAQDLAYGKLTFGDFNRMYGTRGSSPGIKKSIYAKAGELNPAFNPAAFEMGYKLASSPKVQQQLASMDNVKEAVPDLLRISDEAKRTGITALNKFITAGGVQLGNKKYSNLATARTAFADELSGALGFGAATDMAKQMGFDMTRTDLSPEAFKSGINDVVIPFIERKRNTLLKQMGVYGAPQFQPASDQGPVANEKKVQMPDGSIEVFDTAGKHLRTEGKK